MARILGIDPGATSGFCLYDSKARRAIESGTFREHLRSPEFECAAAHVDVVVIERPVAHGPTRPQVVDCAWIAGQLRVLCGAQPLTRLQVKQALTEATMREVVVKNDATAWAALKILHGENCDKKGGALHGVRSHGRAALAVAVAWALRSQAVGASA